MRILSKKKKGGTQPTLELQFGLNAHNVNTSWCRQAKTNTLTAVSSRALFIYKRCLFSVAGQTVRSALPDTCAHVCLFFFLENRASPVRTDNMAFSNNNRQT